MATTKSSIFMSQEDLDAKKKMSQKDVYDSDMISKKNLLEKLSMIVI